jgi:hypothetical protein
VELPEEGGSHCRRETSVHLGDISGRPLFAFADLDRIEVSAKAPYSHPDRNALRTAFVPQWRIFRIDLGVYSLHRVSGDR